MLNNCAVAARAVKAVMLSATIVKPDLGAGSLLYNVPPYLYRCKDSGSYSKIDGDLVRFLGNMRERKHEGDRCFGGYVSTIHLFEGILRNVRGESTKEEPEPRRYKSSDRMYQEYHGEHPQNCPTLRPDEFTAVS